MDTYTHRQIGETASREKDKQIHIHIEKQTNRHVDRETHRQLDNRKIDTITIHTQTNGQIDKIGKQTNSQIDK